MKLGVGGATRVSPHLNVLPRPFIQDALNKRVQKKIEILREIALKVVQMKFLAMHITNQKLSLTLGNVLNIFIEHDH